MVALFKWIFKYSGVPQYTLFYFKVKNLKNAGTLFLMKMFWLWLTQLNIIYRKCTFRLTGSYFLSDDKQRIVNEGDELNEYCKFLPRGETCLICVLILSVLSQLETTKFTFFFQYEDKKGQFQLYLLTKSEYHYSFYPKSTRYWYAFSVQLIFHNFFIFAVWITLVYSNCVLQINFSEHLWCSKSKSSH
jgi:hypothetical protein